MGKDYSWVMENPLGQRLRELPGPLLLTGHTGFKGTWMTFLLEYLNVPVVGYSLPAEKNSLYHRAERKGAIPEALSDIRDYTALEKFIDLHKPSTIIHMAAQPLVLKSYASPRETFDVNVMGTVNVLDIAFKRDFVKAIIVVTTDKVYRNDNSGQAFVETDPLEGKDPYSASKVGTESVVAAWQQIAKVSGGPKVVSVRAGNVIGGGDFAENRIIPDLIRGAMSGKPAEIRNPVSTRPWQHVLDPLWGYLLTLVETLHAKPLKSLNFSPREQSLSVAEVVEISITSWDAIKAQTKSVKLNGIESVSVESKELQLDSSQASDLVKWRPIFTQQEAIVSTIHWWKLHSLKKIPASDLIETDIKEFFTKMHSKHFSSQENSLFQLIRRNLVILNSRSKKVYTARKWKETLLVASVWFVIALSRALPEGFSTKIPVLNIANNSSPEEVRKGWGQGDAGSLLDVAITWANLNGLDPVTQYWIPRLWAPGLSILEVPLIWISRLGIPIYWSLLFLTLTLWSILFSLTWRYFSQFTGRIPMAIISIGLLWSWDFSYLLRDFIFYTEGIGFSVLLIGLILLGIKVISPDETGNRYIYLAGTLIGLSIWIRHTNESGLILLFILSSFGYFRSIRRRKNQSIQGKKRKKGVEQVLLESGDRFPMRLYRYGMISSSLALLITLPWRLISTFHFKGAPLLMSSASGGVPSTIWSLPNSPSGLYWGSYGSNWACKIDLETCNQVQSRISSDTISHSELLLLAFKSTLENPLSYIEERLSFLWVNWIPAFSTNLNFQNLAALAFMLLVFYCIYLCFKVNDKRKYAVITLWGSFLLMNLAQLAIIHYESRYFIPVRLFLLGLLLSLLSLKSSPSQNSEKRIRN
jgi:CDP-glucose 4,6-dehydratase